MTVILAAGKRHKYYQSLVKEFTLVNSKTSISADLLGEYITDYEAHADVVLITDGGLSDDNSENVRVIKSFIDLNSGNKNQTAVSVVSHDINLIENLKSIDGVFAEYAFFSRISEEDIKRAIKSTQKKPVNETNDKNDKNDKKEKNKDFENDYDVWMLEENEPEKPKRKKINIDGGKKGADEDVSDSKFRRVQNRAVAFTGRSGSGVTSTVANLAYAASKKGFKVLIADMDIDFRFINLYFNKFCVQAEESEEISRSLVMTLANPSNYMETAVAVNENLWVCSLGYNFEDKQALKNFVNEQKLSAMISLLKNRFDFVFVDIKLDVLAVLPRVLPHFDTIALCVENNYHAVITTLRMFINHFNDDDVRFINMKAKLIATKYNDESVYDGEVMTPDQLGKYICEGICENFTEELQIAGAVPYVSFFDKQIESDVPVYETNTLLTKAYDDILAAI